MWTNHSDDHCGKICVTLDNAKGGRLIGYARVSTVEQNLDMQIEALRRSGVAERHLHVEKISASAKRRPVFDWALKILRNGDTFIVWRLDRLGRDVRQIHRTLDIIKESGAQVRSLTENLNTDDPYGAFAINMMASLAQLERDQVILRTRAGVDAAKRRGQRFGVLPKLNTEQQAQCKRWKQEGMTVREIRSEVLKKKWVKKISTGAIGNYVKAKKRKT